MNLVALLLLAASAPSGNGDPERVSRPALIEAFRAHCLTGEASAGALGASAAAAGYLPVPVTPPSPGWNEIGAWQRGGVRLFNLSAPPDPPLRPICGVSANIGQLDDDNMLLDLVSRMADFAFVEGSGGRRHSSWIIAGRRFVRVSIDRPSEAEVTVTLLVDAKEVAQ